MRQVLAQRMYDADGRLNRELMFKNHLEFQEGNCRALNEARGLPQAWSLVVGLHRLHAQEACPASIFYLDLQMLRS